MAKIYSIIGVNMEKNKIIPQLKTAFIILSVVLIGVGLFDLAFAYIYKEALELGSCNLCFELNPSLAYCENWKPLNLSNINLTYVSYGK